MTPPKLNQVATWLPMKHDGLNIKVFDSYQFNDNGILKSASETDPVYRYAKNYKRDSVRFSLCIISLENNTGKIEKFLDKVAKTVDYDPKGKAFVRTDIYYK